MSWSQTQRRLQALTMDELQARRVAVQNDPKSQNPLHSKRSIYLYTPAANRKLDDIAWAISHKLGSIGGQR